MINEQMKAKYQYRMGQPFEPESSADSGLRQALAAEYTAYQMGEIRKVLEKISGHLERIAAKP